MLTIVFVLLELYAMPYFNAEFYEELSKFVKEKDKDEKKKFTDKYV